MAEKMRKNRPKRPKNTKFTSDDPTLRVYAASIYDHVFLLEVDSEPLGPGLDARRFSLNSDDVAFCGFFEKLEIFTVQKSVFADFLANGWSDFQNFFFAWKAFGIRFLVILIPDLVRRTVWPLYKIQFLKLKNAFCYIVKSKFPKSVGGFWKKPR